MEVKRKNDPSIRWAAYAAIAFFVIFLIIIIFFYGKKVGLILQAVGITVSVAIAIIALIGEQFRARFFGPKLVLSIFKREGEETYFEDPATKQKTPCRYFHLRVENERKGLVAKKTQVVLRSINSPYKGGENRKVPVGGRLPFKWAYRKESTHPNKDNFEFVYFSNIGPDDLCDIAVLTKDGLLELLPDKWHIIKDQLFIGPHQRAEFEAVAVAENAESTKKRFEISWDGEWPKDNDDAPNHITFREL